MDDILILQANIAILGHIFSIEMKNLPVFTHPQLLFSKHFDVAHWDLAGHLYLRRFFRGRAKVDSHRTCRILLLIMWHRLREVMNHFTCCYRWLNLWIRFFIALLALFLFFCISSHNFLLTNKIILSIFCSNFSNQKESFTGILLKIGCYQK